MSAAITAAVIGAAGTAYFANQAANKQSEAAGKAASLSNDATKEALKQQADAAAQASAQADYYTSTGINQDVYWNQQAQNIQRPYYDAGQNALAKMSAGLSAQDLQADPSYQFRLQQGQQALERAASARGGLYSGRYMKDAMNYNQGAASQEYSNAWNRLATIAGYGQNAANNLSNLNSNLGSSILNAQSNLGSTVGNIWTGNASNSSDLIINNADNQANAQLYKGSAEASEQNALAGILGKTFGGSNGGAVGTFKNWWNG